MGCNPTVEQGGDGRTSLHFAGGVEAGTAGLIMA